VDEVTFVMMSPEDIARDRLKVSPRKVRRGLGKVRRGYRELREAAIDLAIVLALVSPVLLLPRAAVRVYRGLACLRRWLARRFRHQCPE
jgi:hypothetical protein